MPQALDKAFHVPLTLNFSFRIESRLGSPLNNMASYALIVPRSII